MLNKLKFLVCPVCKCHLFKKSRTKLYCKECSSHYEIRDGIPILLPPNLEEFKVLEAEYHDKEAHHYGEINMIDSYHVTHYIDKYLEVVNTLGKDSILLEVGSGDGNDANLITNSGINVIQSDISFEMVNLAKNNKVNSKIIYIVSDAENIPCKDNSLDAIMIVATLHHLPSPKNFFMEARRALKPGGLLIIGFEPNSWPYFIFYPIIRFVKRLVRLDSFVNSKHSGVSIGDSETEGFSYSDFQLFLNQSQLELVKIQRIWFFLGYIHTALSIINSKLPSDKTLKIPLFVQKFIINIDEFILCIPIIRNLCWHWTLVAKKIN